MEFHAIEFEQQVVGEVDVCLVNLVDQEYGADLGRKSFPKLAALDVVLVGADTGIAELAITQTRYRVVFVETLLRLRR